MWLLVNWKSIELNCLLQCILAVQPFFAESRQLCECGISKEEHLKPLDATRILLLKSTKNRARIGQQ